MASNKLKLSALALGVSSALLSTQVAASELEPQNKIFTPQHQSKIERQLGDIKKQNKRAVSWLIELNSEPMFSVSKDQQATQRAQISQAQERVLSNIQSADLNLNVITRTTKLVNALVVNGDESEVRKVLAHEDVKEIYPVYDYELNVADSADYIKATPLVESQIATGEGVRVAVLDTGIDYTHAVFGGEGTQAAYDAATADPTTVTWPQGIVKGGYDYFNNDADPIDFGTSHGTHVSHSVTGIAPNVELFVYSVCGGGCPGLAQLLALESAMDPNGDMDIEDRVDVVNMSLGGDYGDLAEDAVGLFINRAAKLGTSVVISAGNDGAYPFIVGGPSTTENALSVGAMTHPTDETRVAEGTVAGEEAVIQGANFGPGAFSFSSDDIELVYPDANQTACEPFAEGVDFTGKAVVVDRGGCNFTDKVLAAQTNGAAFVIIANNVDDGTPAPMGGFDEAVSIPSVGVTFATGAQLKGGASFNISSELVATPGAMADFTSRGPSVSGLLKPEITAPGVNIMTAEPGTGTGLSGATGTSFSGPITAGAISMLKEALPERNAMELKATLMNAANLDVTVTPRALDENAAMAPISAIGSGLVDVEKAANLPVAAWAKDTHQAALSFGLQSLSETTTMTKTVVVKNFSSSAKTYELSLEQRFADDVERGSLMAEYPTSVTIPAGQSVEFEVAMTIDPTTLPEWQLSGSNIDTLAATELLTDSELDGALVFSEGGEQALHLVYHVLPRAAAKPVISAEKGEQGVVYTLHNQGAAELTPVIVENTVTDTVGDGGRLDIVAGSVETLAVPASFCESGYGVFTTLVVDQPVAHADMGGFAADFDMDGDGRWDVTAHSLNYSLFGGATPTPITFTTPYGQLSGNLSNLYFDSATNYVTLQNCIGDYGLTAADLGNVNATVRFRTAPDNFPTGGSNAVDTAQGNYNFAPAQIVAMAVDAQGDEVQSIAPGESARFLFADANFTILSTNGAKAVVTSPRNDMQVAPSLADAQFSVDENTEQGTVIGTLTAERNATFAGAISEFIVVSSSSTAVDINSDGEVVVANAEQLDYDSGLEQVMFEVVATDTSGNISNTATVMVNVTNLADEASEQPEPQPQVPVKKSTSSGSLGWLALLMAPLMWLRRRRS